MVNVKCMSSLFEQTLVFGFDKNGFYCTGSIHIHAHTAHTHTHAEINSFFLLFACCFVQQGRFNGFMI